MEVERKKRKSHSMTGSLMSGRDQETSYGALTECFVKTGGGICIIKAVEALLSEKGPADVKVH